MDRVNFALMHHWRKVKPNAKDFITETASDRFMEIVNLVIESDPPS